LTAETLAVIAALGSILLSLIVLARAAAVLRRRSHPDPRIPQALVVVCVAAIAAQITLLRSGVNLGQVSLPQVLRLAAGTLAALVNLWALDQRA
jgi:hypothetical protein